ncbi:uncharacterized protein LOC129803179 isoform X2 [Phlebotomus papatasi]|uniref:uncharacterized protein LOC129803179 isoform X2 n=1 Tax=Phlebotomus papatasi TaxID=29031 RepID=UPI0024845D98|nr:uncharacterized protein LOC129803179 isoform X2 [Phlebotomus papatasi]
MEYVTVVSVDNGAMLGDSTAICGEKNGVSAVEKSPDSPFITVLAIGDNPTAAVQAAENVVVYRLPGERLGFGLKFQGGTKSNEKIQRLFIQSCAPDSPASRATASWGFLREGDEILEIDGVSVTRMTRIECVRCLKESNVAIKLVVRNGEGRPADVTENLGDGKANSRPPKPPPVPPRKLNKRRIEVPVEQPPAQSQTIKDQQRHSLRAENGFTPPPDAEFYLNLFSEENDSNFRGSESDDTGSTISTVIDKYKDVDQISVNSSKSVELAKVLKPFTLLEKEFNVENAGKLEECLMRLQPPAKFQDDQVIIVQDEQKVRIVNESEPTRVKVEGSDPAPESDYENVTFQSAQRRAEVQKYENVVVEPIPPKPLPRQVITVEPKKRTIVPTVRPRESTKKPEDPPSTSPEYTTIENWLQGAHDRAQEAKNNPPLKQCIKVPATDEEDDGYVESSSDEDVEKVYEPILMEKRDSSDGEEGEKLGPPELLAGPGPSEAYFNNFHWSGPVMLPTIGEVEEELSSLEPQTQQSGPLVIINGGEEVLSASPGGESIEARMESPKINSEEVDGKKAESDNVTEALARDTDIGKRDYVANGSDKRTNVDVSSPGRSSAVPLMREKSPSEEITSASAISVASDAAACSDSVMDVTVTKIERIILGTEHGTCVDVAEKSPATDHIATDIRNTNAEIEGTPDTQQVIQKTPKTAPQHKEDMERSALVNNCTTLSTHLSPPPPTFSRLPPDGHEFPPNFSDTEPTTQQTQSGKSPVKTFLEEAPPLPKSVPPPLISPRVSQPRQELLLKMDVERPQNGTVSLVEMRKKSIESTETAQTGRVKPFDSSPRKSSLNSMWRKDERSEKSVKDKIAMFSNPDTTQGIGDLGKKGFNRSTEDLLDKCDYASHKRVAKSESLTKKARSVENLDVDDVPKMNSGCDVELRPKAKVQQVEMPNYSSLPRRNGGLAGSGQLTRTISFSGYGSGVCMDDRRRNSITNMLETRKKSMSKLRGLVIPERVAPEPVLLDLPEIKSADLQKVVNGSRFSMPDVSVASPVRSSHVERKIKMTLPSPPSLETRYKSIFEGTRRPLTTSLSRPLMATNGHGDHGDDEAHKIPPLTPPVKPPRTSLIVQKTPQTDDSEDSDSVVSSRISTPVGSPVVPHGGAEKLPLTRTLSSETNTSIASSTTSTLTSGSGSQASCSSLGSTPTVDMKRRVVKSSSNESGINRKSILASAKSRSGRGDDHTARSTRYEDEDSTDGYDEDEIKRPKPKIRNSLTNGKANQPDHQMINYKLVDTSDIPSIVDRVINVATFVEVVSDSEEVIPKVESVKSLEVEKNVLDPIRRLNHSSSDELSDGNEMNEVAKWVRKEAAKTIEEPTELVKNVISVEPRAKDKGDEIVPTTRTIPKSLSEQKKLSTADIRRQFESKSSSSPFVPSPTRQTAAPTTPTNRDKVINYHDRFSSWESVASNSSSGVSSMPARSIQSNGSETMQSTPTDFGSFSSLGSSHSLITAQDLQFIIEEADPPLQTHEAFVVVLQRDSPECSIGITLAGGADYEAKEITVHKILSNSPADKDGRLKKGDRILAINGLSMRGLTHRESVTVLKTPRPEVVVVVTRSPSVSASALTKTKRSSLGSLTSLTEKEAPEVGEPKLKSFHKASRSLDLDIMVNEDVATSRESLKEENGIKSPPVISSGISTAAKLGNGTVDADDKLASSFVKLRTVPKGSREVEVVKDSCGLGFSIEGGFDSPLGNRPLLVKKVFMGGAAEKSGKVKNGDEIVGINGFSMATVSRVDAWSYMKRLPIGPVKIVLL